VASSEDRVSEGDASSVGVMVADPFVRGENCGRGA
jgi:hypothetical protein